MLLNLHFANNPILWCFFFLNIDLYFLVPLLIQQIFNPIAELIFPMGIPEK